MDRASIGVFLTHATKRQDGRGGDGQCHVRSFHGGFGRGQLVGRAIKTVG
jgi:hypothetical protein